METETGTPAKSIFARWLREHKTLWIVIGAVLIVGTYVSKEIAQARLENKIQSVERWRVDVTPTSTRTSGGRQSSGRFC